MYFLLVARVVAALIYQTDSSVVEQVIRSFKEDCIQSLTYVTVLSAIISVPKTNKSTCDALFIDCMSNNYVISDVFIFVFLFILHKKNDITEIS